jgi:hypothetical protein
MHTTNESYYVAHYILRHRRKAKGKKGAIREEERKAALIPPDKTGNKKE